MPDIIRIGSAAANKGEKVWGEIPVPAAYVDQIKSPRVVLVNGTSDGPIVYIGAGTHGDEFNSIEAVRRAAISLDPGSVRGAVVFVPTHNRAAFEARRRHTPADDKDLDYCYPGDQSGSPTEVLAHLLFHEAIMKAGYALDLHTAARGGWNLFHAMTAPNTPEASAQAQDLAHMFGARVIVTLEAPAKGHVGERMGWNLDHSLFVQASASNIPCPILELGEGGRLDADLVERGIRGITNVLAGLGVLDAIPTPHPAPFVAREAVAIRCTKRGFLYLTVQAGDRLQKGQLVARVVSFPDETEEIRSPCDGVVVRETTEGVVLPNDRVVVLATS